MSSPNRNHASSAARGQVANLWNSARYGRARARIPRILFVTFVVVMSLAGLRSVVAPSHPTAEEATPDETVDYAVQNFATEFARAYLTFDGARPERREDRLAPFLPASLNADAGFSPPASGTQKVAWTSVAQVQRPTTKGTIITVAVGTTARLDPIYLSVPVERGRGGAISLNGYPALVGPPLIATPALEETETAEVDDPEVETLISRALTNYLAGDAENLAADLAEAATITLPPVALRMSGIQRLEWIGAVASGAALATVDAVDEKGSTYILRYEVGLRRVEGTDPRIAPGWRVTYVQTISQET